MLILIVLCTFIITGISIGIYFIRIKSKCPKYIILIRHGESEGNLDHTIYRIKPDNRLHLTHLGWQQGVASGKLMKEEFIKDTKVRFIVSPYVRTLETLEGILTAWTKDENQDYVISEEPRIREQDFGNFQDPEKIKMYKSQRKNFGAFFYRFPCGESPADVYDRISYFLHTLFSMFQKGQHQCYVLVTHGVTIRVLLMHLLKYSIDQFEQLENFKNGEFIVLEYHGIHEYRIKCIIEPQLTSNPNEEQCTLVGYKRYRSVRKTPLIHRSPLRLQRSNLPFSQ